MTDHPERTTSVCLTDSELVQMDGECRDEVRAVVDAARRRMEAAERLDLAPHLAGFVADVVSEAKSTGRLIYRHVRLRKCPLCEVSRGHAKFQRGPRRGRPNPDKPLYLQGVEVAERFVRIKGMASLGCCKACWDAVVDTLREELADIRAELPDVLAGEVRYQKHERVKCNECGWEGHEGQMVMLPAVMGGEYPGGCPKCDARNHPLGRTLVKRVDGFVCVEARP